MVIIRALIAVIHAILQTAASTLIAGFSLLILVVIALVVVGALIATVAGGLGFGGLHWLRRHSRDRKDSDENDDTSA